MNFVEVLHERSGSQCELCSGVEALAPYGVAPYAAVEPDRSVLLCKVCLSQLDGSAEIDKNHWRCLSNSMWTANPAVLVVVWRLLNKLANERWAKDLFYMLYLDDETLAWAKQGDEEETAEEKIIHKDSNGAVLQGGDTVALIKDLDVKGGGFTAKRGTIVKGIALVEGNSDQIEGRVNGQQIVILTQFVKKSN